MEKQKKKILVIDDNRDNIIVLRALISESFPDIAILAAETGESGYELCISENPDLILLDIVMPDMDGYEVCRKVKDNKELKFIPVVMLTANLATREGRIQSLEAGADAFLTKPVDESELRAQIKAMLRLKELEDHKMEQKRELEDLVIERTQALATELADKIKAESKLMQSLDKLKMNRLAILNLMEDLKVENNERKKTEEILKQDRNLLRTLVDNLPDPVSIKDKDGKYLLNNRAHLKLIGAKTQDETSDKTTFDFFSQKFANEYNRIEQDILKSGVPLLNYEENFIRKLTGETRWHVTSRIPLPDPNNVMDRILTISYDISDRKIAEEKLKESEEKYRLLIENQGEGVGIVDLNEKFIFANPAANAMFGVGEGSLVDRSLLDFVIPDQMEIVKKQTKKRSKKTKSSYELIVIKATGERVTILITATPYNNANGDHIGTFGVFRDITDRKKAETELLNRQKFIEAIIENSPIGFAVNRIDDGSIVYVGSKFEEIYGVERGSLTSVEKFFELVYTDPDQRELLRAETLEGMASGIKERMKWEDIRILTRNGEEKYVTAVNIPVDEQNLMISTVQDVTLRKKMEDVIVESEAYYRTLIDISPDGIVTTNLDGLVTYSSIKAHEIFKVPPGVSVIGSNVISWISPEFSRSVLERYSDILAGNVAPETKEYRLINYSGETFWAELSSSPFSDKNGKVSGLLFVCRDISERKKAEDDLVNARNRAEESDRLKTAFLHNISHEIRTPMNAIVGFSSLLAESGNDTDTTNAYIEIIIGSSNHLLSIINDIIDISNLEAGIVKVNKQEVNVNAIIRTLVRQFQPKAEEKQIELVTSLELDDEDANLRTDQTKFQQIITNLISNAVKFTSKGTIKTGYTVKNNIISFYVSDNGIGIARDHLDRIFDRFYQVEDPKLKLHEGTGLGLSISKGYADLLGGNLTVNSEPGIGTEFLLTLPMETSIKLTKIENEMVTGTSFRFKKRKRILVAEDIDSNFKLISYFLSSSNSDVVRAENGKEAVEIIKSGAEIDLILMDIKMPVMDGLTATKIIRDIKPLLPIIVQTAYADDRESSMQSGCSGFLPKPFDRKKLLEVLMKFD